MVSRDTGYGLHQEECSVVNRKGLGNITKVYEWQLETLVGDYSKECMCSQ